MDLKPAETLSKLFRNTAEGRLCHTPPLWPSAFSFTKCSISDEAHKLSPNTHSGMVKQANSAIRDTDFS